jgi:hypothetical protein
MKQTYLVIGALLAGFVGGILVALIRPGTPS